MSSALAVACAAPRVAALYISPDGPYSADPRFDAWDEARDARAYRGPLPVVAHPPCKRWGRYWSGGPSAKTPRLMGDDDGCFAAALWAVRTFGGVVEHPEASHAWRWFGLPRPARAGGWTEPDSFGGRSCCVEQGQYGHPARKATWLYLVSPNPPPELRWGPAEGCRRLEDGYHSTAERKRARLARARPTRRISELEMLVTPPAFAELLLSLAEPTP